MQCDLFNFQLTYIKLFLFQNNLMLLLLSLLAQIHRCSKIGYGRCWRHEVGYMSPLVHLRKPLQLRGRIFLNMNRS